MQNECILHAYDFLIIEIQWFFFKVVAKNFARRITNWDWNIILEVYVLPFAYHFTKRSNNKLDSWVAP